MSRAARQNLLAEIAEVQRLLDATSESRVLSRISLQSRLKSLRAELDLHPADEREPARTAVTFRGKPVVGTHGVLAKFGAEAAHLFDDCILAVAANMHGPLADMGPLPGREQHRLLITGTALGSFGFVFEEHSEGRLFQGDGSNIHTAMAATQELLSATVEDDEVLGEVVAGLDRRTLQAVRKFLTKLAEEEAVCAMEFGDKRFAFRDVEQVRLAAERLDVENVHEETVTFGGRFLGVLPESRRFEFRKSDGVVIRGKVGPAVAKPEDINDSVSRTLFVRFEETRVGSGLAKYTLAEWPQDRSGTLSPVG
jgi:hypothetical protein